VAVLASGVPDHSGGSAPDSHRLPIATDLEPVDRTAAVNGPAAPALDLAGRGEETLWHWRGAYVTAIAKVRSWGDL
jgi:hypothetical protein